MKLIPESPATTARALRRRIADRQVSAVEAVKAALDRADQVDPHLGAFLELFPERALSRAASVDALIASGAEPGSLAGVPVALKDNICLNHGRTTCGSKYLAQYRSPFSATAAARLEAAGAIVIGKTNLDEFAMGSSTENSGFFPARNPWDTSRVPGGSSGGSAAAVAAGIVPVALGSDTGGSIRQPAGFCGVVGIKPTYGRVSRYGLVAYASSLDQIGPLSTSVDDAALTLNVICGKDPRDSTSSMQTVPDFSAGLGEAIDGLRIAVPWQARNPANHPDVARVLDETIRRLTAQGAMIVNVDLPMTDYGIAAYYIVATAEASSNLARFDGVRYGRRAQPGPGEDLLDLYCRSRAEGFGPEVRRRIMLGTHVLSSGYYDAYYARALKARRLIKRDFDAVFNSSADEQPGCHALLMPVAPHPAFALGEKTSDPLAMYLEDVYTVTVNLAGLPAISVPSGFTSGDSKLPIGMQLVGRAFDEATLLRVAKLMENSDP